MQCNFSDWNLLRTSCKTTMEFVVITFVRMSAVQKNISLTGNSFISGHIYNWFISDSEGENAAKLIALITSCYSVLFP